MPVEWKDIESAKFIKWNKKWYLTADESEDLNAGDHVQVHKVSGGISYVELVENVPYVSPNDKQRWTFKSRTKDDTEYGISERFGEAAIRDEIAEDGYPAGWSRKEDGSVRWPRDGSVWRLRNEGSVGPVKRDRKNPKNIGWYDSIEDKTWWLLVPVFMDDFEYVAKSVDELN